MIKRAQIIHALAVEEQLERARPLAPAAEDERRDQEPKSR
jgi:hypothetical protein